MQLAPKPAPDLRTSFQSEYFDNLVAGWKALPGVDNTIIIEDTPWAYLARHNVHVDAHTR